MVTRPRDSGIDFAKGALVVGMVVYHWMNYFVSGDWFYRYIRFVTPGFICMTGFLISHVLLASGRGRGWKLCGRGARLLVLFTVLNLVIGMLVPQNHAGRALGGTAFLENLVGIYVTGDLSGGGAAFWVLVPISYLLIFAGLLVLAAGDKPRVMMLVCLPVCLGLTGLGVANRVTGMPELFNFGLLGLLLGFVPVVPNRLGWVVACYVVQLVALTKWGAVYLLQISGVVLNLLLLYGVGRSVGGRVGEVARLLGQYSLLGYIGQIVVLQGLHRVLDRSLGMVIVALVGAFVGTYGIVWGVDWWRRRSEYVNRVYGMIFG